MTSCDFTELDPACLSTHNPTRRIAWHGSAAPEDTREVPEEEAVALTYNGATHTVMMATPNQLEDFAVGFSLTEGIISDPDQIKSIEIAAFTTGVEARLWVEDECAERLAQRRRAIAGPTGFADCAGLKAWTRLSSSPRTSATTIFGLRPNRSWKRSTRCHRDSRSSARPMPFTRPGSGPRRKGLFVPVKIWDGTTPWTSSSAL